MSTQSTKWIAAARVLRRSGFGTQGTEVDTALEVSGTDIVNRLLKPDRGEDNGVEATALPTFETVESPAKRASDKEFRKYRDQLSDQMEELSRWWVRRMIAVEQPFVEKLTLLWHNHFATSASKVKIANQMAIQNKTLREHVLGDFGTLAYAMLTDPAMIVWLDGRGNKSGSPNENLAREFMELFALGHGSGYSERDVREGARALTGWTTRGDQKSVFVAKYHDGGKKSILGSNGKFDAADFCNLVVSHRKSAEFVSGRLWQQLASDTPASKGTLQRLTTAYGRGRDLRALTAAVLTDPDFVDRKSTVVVSPVEWAVGLARALRISHNDSTQVDAVLRTLKLLGQRPFYPPNVGGWPHGRAWLSTSAAVIRLQASDKMIRDGDLSAVTDSPIADRIDAAGYLIGVGAWSDRTVAALKPLRMDPRRLVTAAVNSPEYLTS